MSESGRSRRRRAIWYAATIVALAGVIGLDRGWQRPGTVLVVTGVGVLVFSALLSTLRITRGGTGRHPGGLVGLVVVAGFLLAMSAIGLDVLSLRLLAEIRAVAFATGAQALLFVLAVRSSGRSRLTRWLVPVAGHGTVLFGSVLALELGPFEYGTALLAYAIGFSSLALHAFWMRQRATEHVVPPRPDTEPRRWESVLILAVFVGVVGAAVATIAVRPGEFGLVVRSDGMFPEASIAGTAATIAGGAAIVGFATLAAPPKPPEFLDVLTGNRVTVLQHALTLVILLNALLVVALINAPWGFIRFWACSWRGSSSASA